MDSTPSRTEEPFGAQPRFEGLRIADLEIFITAAREENLSRAASMHHLSQSAASTAVCRLERALGTSLCKHEKRQFALTHLGKCLLPKLEKWLMHLKEMLSSRQEPPALRLATTHALAKMTLEPVLSAAQFELQLMRPDQAHQMVLKGHADIAIVLDNSPWEGVEAVEVGKGAFRLYSSDANAPLGPVLLPEDQIEVLTLQQRWLEVHGSAISIKARIPSWSLIADICSQTSEVGFLPDFLALKANLHPVSWQPETSFYRVLAIYRKNHRKIGQPIEELISKIKIAF